jgi:hypothetical protein
MHISTDFTRICSSLRFSSVPSNDHKERERERERESGRGGRVGDETIFIINSTSKCFDEGHNDETASTAGHLQVQYHNR